MDKRNYASDSIKQSEKLNKNKQTSINEHLKFHFDNALSKTKNFVVFLVLLSMFLGFIMSLLKYYLLSEDSSFGIDDWWNSFTKILGIGAGDSWAARLLNFLYWSMSIAISGSVIGFIAKGISNITEYLKRGRSKIITYDHILILGWSNNIYAIISELLKANENVSNAKIVIFSSLKNQEMQDLLMLNLSSNAIDKIITRSGDITSPRDLNIVNPGLAKSIIVLGNNNNDIEVTLAVMAIYSKVVGANKTVVVQINDKKSINYFKGLSDINVIPVFSNDIIVNVCAQAIRQRGIGTVVLDFMDFDGNEIYYYKNDSMVGKSYYEASLSFNNASLIGICNHRKEVQLNPSKDTTIKSDDQLVFVAEDDSKINFTGLIKITKEFDYEPQYTSDVNRNLLIIGWSKFAKEVLKTFISFEDSKKQLFLICNDTDLTTDYDKEKITIIDDNKESLNFEFIQENNITEVLILPFSDSLSDAENDTLTLIKMIELNNLNKSSEDFKVRVIAYLLDSSKVTLASFTETEELIVSDNLSALIMAQYAENPQLLPVFNDIFDAEGASLTLVNANELISTDTIYSYSDLVHIGLLNSLSVIGIISNEINDNSSGVRINISKDEKVHIYNSDKLIVIK